MNSMGLISVILLTTIGLAFNSPNSSQTAFNSQLKQAFDAQQWRRTIQVVNQVNGSTDAQPSAKLTLYKALLSHK